MDESGVASAPHANIGPRGCRRRGRMGWFWLVLGVVLVVGLAMRDASIGWYGLAVLPFFLGTLGYFQAREQTCVFFAAVGQRDMDGGAQRIADPGELARVRAQATRVWTRAVLAALTLTAVAIIVASAIA